MGTLLQDLRYGLRMLAKNPGFTAVAVLTLALGIGANTAIFTLIDALMLKALPVENPRQLVLFSDDASQGIMDGDQFGRFRYFSNPLYEYFRDHNQFFEGLCAFRKGQDRVSVRVEGSSTAAGTLQHSQAKLVSGNYFSVLGVSAVVGRTLSPGDDRVEAHPVAVISYGYWKRRFSRDASVLGRTVDLNGVSTTIVGVTRPEFFGETVETPPDFWVPLSMQPQVIMRESFLKKPDTYWLNLLGRLRPRVSRREAQPAVNVQLRQFLTERAGSQISARRQRDIQASRVELAPGGPGISTLRFIYSESLHALMASVALVLLIACANVANLLLSRAAARGREISMRLALGASRVRLVRQLLTESLLLAGAGGLLGTLLAAWGVRLLVMLVSGSAHSLLKTDPDVNVLGFTLGVSLATAILFGLAPALRATRIEPGVALKSNAPGLSAAGSRLQFARGLVVLQVALSLLLLVAAGLLVRSLTNLVGQDLGFERQRVLVVGIDPRVAGYKPHQLPGLYRDLHDRVSVIPGVRSVAVANYSPMSGASQTSNVSIQGYTRRPGQNMDVQRNQVGSKYFETLDVPLLLGRGIGSQDTETSPKVAVVNETFARYFFPKENPLGRRFGLGDPAREWVEIVGVVKDVKYNDMTKEAPRMVYFPVLQMDELGRYVSELEIRAVGDPRGVAAEVRRVISETDKNLPVTRVTTLSDQVNRSLRRQRIMAKLSSFFGLLALLLACVGVYGIMAYAVARRTNEIGIRMALGAQHGDVLWMVLRETLVLIALGIAIGIPAALGASRLISSLLFGLKSTDPTTIALATLAMITVAAFAGYIPARRATKIDPMVALRYE